MRDAENENIYISYTLEDNKTFLKNRFNGCSDFMMRETKITNNPKLGTMFAYIDNMVKTDFIEETLIKKLTYKNEGITYTPGSKEYSQYLLGIRDEDIFTDMNAVVDLILSGKIVLFTDGLNTAMIINANSPPGRGIEEPEVESVIRGPREGFTESVATNIALVRKKIKSTNLKMESFKLGRETKTNVTISYLSHIANGSIVKEVRERISKIDCNAVLGANYIKEYIQDEHISGFPTIFSTERPEVAAGKLLEGRIAIFVDGTPLVCTVPAVFIEFFLTSEDYYLNYIPVTINRWIRYISFIIALILPGGYVAITTFHQEVIPTPLLVTIMKARSNVPYPALVECLLMLSVYEILREAGVRMPRAVGQAISVVGALVLGQAAVEAGLVSTPMVIVVAITAISTFAIPLSELNIAITFPRFIFLILGGTLGLLGLIIGIIILLLKLISIRSFGVPYMGPLAPVIQDELLDVFMRRPIWARFKRPWLITWRRSIKRKQKSRIKEIKEEHAKSTNKK